MRRFGGSCKPECPGEFVPLAVNQQSADHFTAVPSPKSVAGPFRFTSEGSTATWRHVARVTSVLWTSTEGVRMTSMPPSRRRDREAAVRGAPTMRVMPEATRGQRARQPHDIDFYAFRCCSSLAPLKGRSLKRLPVALNIALAMAPAVGPIAASATPRNAVPGRSIR